MSYHDLQGVIVTNAKKDAFVGKLPGKLRKDQYLNFVEWDNILIDPATHTIDENSVESAVSKFMDEYSDLVDSDKMPKLKSTSSNFNVGQVKSDTPLEERLHNVLTRIT